MTIAFERRWRLDGIYQKANAKFLLDHVAEHVVQPDAPASGFIRATSYGARRST